MNSHTDIQPATRRRGRPQGSTRLNNRRTSNRVQPQYTEWGGRILRHGITCHACRLYGGWCPGGSELTNLALTCRRFQERKIPLTADPPKNAAHDLASSTC